MRTNSHIRICICAVGAALICGSHAAEAGNAVHMEGVNDYTGGNISLGTDANEFYTTMTGNGWAGYEPLNDGNVWDVDFFDPQLTGGTSPDDVDYGNAPPPVEIVK